MKGTRQHPCRGPLHGRCPG